MVVSIARWGETPRHAHAAIQERAKFIACGSGAAVVS